MILAKAGHGTEIAPTVPFVKGGVVGHEIERVDPAFFHILADIGEKLSRDPLAAPVLFNVESAEIGGEIDSVVKIVFNDPRTADYATAVYHRVPGGDGGGR